MIIEAIGISATLFVLVSMCFKTLSYRGSFYMRLLNIVGSIIFVIYGILLPAWSTAILNGCLVFVNAYNLAILVRDHKKETENQKTEDK